MTDNIVGTLIPFEKLISPWDYKRWLLRMPTLREIEAAPAEELHYRNNMSLFVEKYPDQEDRGTCVSFSNGLDAQINERWETGVRVELSEEDLYWKARRHDGIPDFAGEGSNNLGAMKARQKEGICLEATRPYRSAGNTKPEAEYLAESGLHVIDSYYQLALLPSVWKTSIAGIISAPQWDGPKPIVTAYKVTQTMLDYAWEHSGLLPEDPGTDILGGHSSLFAAYKPIDGILHFGNWNSWGPDRGDGGWLWFPEGYLLNGIILEGMISHNGPPISPQPPEPGSDCVVAGAVVKTYNTLNAARGGRTRLRAIVP